MTQWGLDTLFNPAKRHMDEEKRRLQSTRQQVGDNSGGKRVDLESGRVKIHRTEVDENDGDEQPVKPKHGKKHEPTRAERAAEPSAAAKRAAARRGRTVE